MANSEVRNLSEIRSKLDGRFSADDSLLDRVMDKVERAQQMEELTDLHWDDPETLADHIKSFSQGHGLKAGWNTWIGIQRTDTSHLTLD